MLLRVGCTPLAASTAVFSREPWKHVLDVQPLLNLFVHPCTHTTVLVPLSSRHPCLDEGQPGTTASPPGGCVCVCVHTLLYLQHIHLHSLNPVSRNTDQLFSYLRHYCAIVYNYISPAPSRIYNILPTPTFLHTP